MLGAAIAALLVDVGWGGTPAQGGGALERELDALVHAKLKEFEVPGCGLAIVRGGRLIFAKGYGLADVEAGTSFLPQTAARIGSVSKPITALAILALAKQGKLDLDKPLLKYLDMAPYPASNDRIAKTTIRNVLQHATGYDEKASGNLTVDWSPVAKAFGKNPPTKDQIVRVWMGANRSWEPGTAFHYDNAGYLALGRVVENVSGTSYEDYVRTAVLAPLGIRDMRIGCSDVSRIPRNEATPYDGSGRKAKTTPGEQWESCGGWAASAVDLSKIVRGLMGSRIDSIVSQKYSEQLFARPAFEPPDASGWYGLGWGIAPAPWDRKRLLVGHAGSGGVGCAAIKGRWDGTYVCVVANRDSGEWLSSLWDAIGTRILDATPVESLPSVDLFRSYPG